MDLVLQKELPGLKLAEAMMFGFPTGTVDIWEPTIERIILPEVYSPPVKVEIKVASEVATTSKFSWKRKLLRALKKPFNTQKPIDCSGKFIFDGRFDIFKNISHIIHNVATPALLAKEVLSAHLDKDVEITVILNKAAENHKMPSQVYKLLGIPVIYTDERVYGDTIALSEYRYRNISTKPEIFDIELPHFEELAFDKVFIPRRGYRSIINNDEITAFLVQRGFKVCYYEDFSVAEQWSITRNAKTVVAVHGASVSSLEFNRLGLHSQAGPGDGVRVVEIFSPGWIHAGCRVTVNAMNGRWCAVRGQVTPTMLKAVDFSGKPLHPRNSPHKNPFTASCESLEMALDYVNDDAPYS